MPFIGGNKGELFVRGFECGQVWEMVKEGQMLKRKLIHRLNIPQISVLLETFGLEGNIELASEHEDEEWAYLTIKSVVKLPADCQSKEDGVCRLPKGTCEQCII